MYTEKLFELTSHELVSIDGGYYPPDKGSNDPWEIDWTDILVCW